MIARLAWLAATFAVAVPAGAQDLGFDYDVLPWLQARGCSAAACHGGAGGRGGFALSLFGSDPDADYVAITGLDDGRRVDLAAPAESLLVAKPSRALPHRGGKRIAVDGDAWSAWTRWIAAGAPRHASTERPPVLAGLRGALVDDGGTTRLRVTATFRRGRDGATFDRDVTDRATFAMSAPGVATIDAAGVVRERGPGESYVFARFGGRSERVGRVLVPTDGTAGSTAASPVDGASAEHALDAAVRARLDELGTKSVLAGRRTAPAALLARRLWLDLAGRPPRADELDAFVTDLDPAGTAASRERVATTAARLLASSDFVDVAVEWFAAVFDLPASAPGVRRTPAALAIDRARDVLRDELAREVVSLERLVDAFVAFDGPWLQRHGDARDRAEATARGFLGLRIGCARCHDHPHDRWRQREHLAFSALFSSPRPAALSAAGGAVPGKLFDARGREVERAFLALDDAVRAPRAEAATDLAPVRAFLRRDPGARRQMARHFANAIDARLFGPSLVAPIDDHRPTNPARHELVLEVLTDRLLALDFDLRAFVAWLVTSRRYAAAPAGPVDPVAAASARAPLGAELVRRPSRELSPWLVRRAAFRALGIDRTVPAAPPPSPLADQLAWLHGDDLAPLVDGPNLLDLLLLDGVDDADRVDRLWRALLSRRPTPAERAAVASSVPTQLPPRQRLAAIAHAIVNSRAFRFLR